MLSGGVEELQYSTGTSPVETRAALEPRLPGVLSATRWVGTGAAGWWARGMKASGQGG